MADIVPTPARGLADIPGVKQVGLLAGVAAAVAAAIWLVMWSQGQNYTVLYGQLSERESGQVMDALTAAGIEFKLNPSGAVSVPGIQSAGSPHSPGEPGAAAKRCHGNRNDSKGFRIRHQLHDGERPLSISAGDGIGAHHHQGAGSAGRKGAFGAAEALGFLARRPQGHRLGDAAAVPGQTPRSGAGRGDRALGGLERAGIVRQRRDIGGSGRIAAQLARRELRRGRQYPAIRIHAQARGELSAPHRGIARTNDRAGTRARDGDRRS